MKSEFFFNLHLYGLFSSETSLFRPIFCPFSALFDSFFAKNLWYLGHNLIGHVVDGLVHSSPPGAPPSCLLSFGQRNEMPWELLCMGKIRGAYARSRLTIACVIEGNACEIDEV